jgi:solute carrier family 25 iron transporter 28/37
MNVPYTAIHFATYESAKQFLSRSGGRVDEGLAVQLGAGGLAGGLAAAATTPLDVVKTRLQLEGLSSAARHHGGAVGPVLRRIAREEGAAALWRGWQPRTLFHAPSAAICWGIYETCKDLLGGAPPA